MKLVNPANKRKYTIIVVGTGLAGASAAASLGELGYNVLNFCIQDSPRRAHSIAAQGGINAAKNYQNDGDSVYRLFYDTVKGGDYRSREANVYRLAQLSVNIIDQCVAQGVPFAREYGGLLDNRSFGGAQVSRTFYARGQTGQQLLLGAYQSLMRQVAREDGQAVRRAARCSTSSSSTARRAASSCRNLDDRRDRALRRRRGHPRDRRLRHGLLPVDQRGELERHRGVARAQARRALRQPVLHADPPDLHSGQRRPPVEADADEREPAQRRPRLGAEDSRATRGRPSRFPKTSATTTSNGSTRASATSCRATSRRATPSRCATKAAASATAAWRSISISRTRSQRLGVEVIKERYGNLFDMYQQDHRRGSVQGADAHLPRHPLHDGRAVGGLQPDEHRSRAARARRSELLRPRRQPPRRQRADAGAGRRLLRHPVHDRRLPRRAAPLPKVTTDHDAFKEAADNAQEQHRHAAVGQGQRAASARSTASSARIMWDDVGMARTEASLQQRARSDPEAARRVLAERLGAGRRRQPEPEPRIRRPRRRLPRVRRAAGARRARTARESCGGHFREESQTPDGEALRDDEHFSYVAAWEFKGVGQRAGAAQGAARCSRKCIRRSGATSSCESSGQAVS